MKRTVDYLTLKACQLVGELDRLFTCELDGWLPVNGFEVETVVQENIVTIIIIRPANWPVTSYIMCKAHTHILRLTEIVLKASHIHNTAIGGIDITLPVCDLPGITIGPPIESGSPASAIINSILLKKYPLPQTN